MSYFSNGVTGHRGDVHHYPENTLAGFVSAIDMGCDWCETDLRLTRDGRIVLSHDHHTGSVAGRRLIIREHDFNELRELNTAVFFNQVHFDRAPMRTVLASLEELFELFRSQNTCRISLQPKEPETLPLVRKIATEMKIDDELLGFNDGSLEAMRSARELFPGARIFYDVRPQDIDAELDNAGKYGFQEVVVWEYGITSEITAKISERGLVPGVWTPNAPAEMDRFLDMGVKRFYTDFPEVLLRKVKVRSFFA